MNEEAEIVSVIVTDPESLARGLQLIDTKIVELWRAVSEMATLLGIAISLKEGAENPSLTLTEALLSSIEQSEKSGLLSSPILGTLRQALQAGINASPPPDRGTRLRIVQGEKKAA
jgi:hypothetical protein